jgi:hypothetical protein
VALKAGAEVDVTVEALALLRLRKMPKKDA